MLQRGDLILAYGRTEFGVIWDISRNEINGPAVTYTAHYGEDHVTGCISEIDCILW